MTFYTLIKRCQKNDNDNPPKDKAVNTRPRRVVASPIAKPNVSQSDQVDALRLLELERAAYDRVITDLKVIIHEIKYGNAPPAHLAQSAPPPVLIETDPAPPLPEPPSSIWVAPAQAPAPLTDVPPIGPTHKKQFSLFKELLYSLSAIILGVSIAFAFLNDAPAHPDISRTGIFHNYESGASPSQQSGEIKGGGAPVPKPSLPPPPYSSSWTEIAASAIVVGITLIVIAAVFFHSGWG